MKTADILEHVSRWLRRSEGEKRGPLLAERIDYSLLRLGLLPERPISEEAAPVLPSAPDVPMPDASLSTSSPPLARLQPDILPLDAEVSSRTR